jgi:shikimate dehydrogenase
MSNDLKQYRVLVTPSSYGKNDPRLITELESTVGEVIYNRLGRSLTSEEVSALLPGIDGYIAGLDIIDRAALESADRLKVIARYGVGYDRIDVDWAARKGIMVTNTPEANTVSVAELTIGLMLAAARSIVQHCEEVKKGGWPRGRGATLEGKTVGLVGFGSIGREVARRLAGWGCHLLAYDPAPEAATSAAELGVTLLDLDQLLAQSHFVSLHVPLTVETRNMVNGSFLARMQAGAFLVNTARGEVVDEEALVEAIKSGHLAGAALDALSSEPPTPGNPLYQLPQVIATPHCGAHTDRAMDKMGWGSLRSCLAVLRGQSPADRVFPKGQQVIQHLKTQDRPTMYFIGVTTAKSSIMRVFPLWMEALGHPEARIEGMDLSLHDDPQNYRNAVAQIKYDPLSMGALVTAHKINLLEAARDMFEYLDPYAVTCGEISSISKSDLQLEGHAKDPITSGLSLDSILGEGYFGRNGGEVLCLGAGGSTTAIILHLAQKLDPRDRPRRMIIVNRSPARIEHLKTMASALGTDIEFEYHLNARPEYNDALMAKLPSSSVVINATGMGKDLPGSPITDQGLFPMDGIVWELNYRGELEFLHQALSQHESRRLTVEDGWLYFLHGWTQVISQVFQTPIEGAEFDKLAQIAGAICTPTLPQRVTPSTTRASVAQVIG